jgi:hypothetical protein
MSEGVGAAVRFGAGPRRSFLGPAAERTTFRRRTTERIEEAL